MASQDTTTMQFVHSQQSRMYMRLEWSEPPNKAMPHVRALAKQDEAAGTDPWSNQNCCCRVGDEPDVNI